MAQILSRVLPAALAAGLALPVLVVGCSRVPTPRYTLELRVVEQVLSTDGASTTDGTADELYEFEGTLHVLKEALTVEAENPYRT